MVCLRLDVLCEAVVVCDLPCFEMVVLPYFDVLELLARRCEALVALILLPVVRVECFVAATELVGVTLIAGAGRLA